MAHENTPKEKNAAYFHREASKFLADPLLKNKFVVIQSEKIQASFDTFSAALEFAVSKFPPEEFIIRQVINEKEQINFLIGRDILSHWSLTWHGPTSTVLISD